MTEKAGIEIYKVYREVLDRTHPGWHTVIGLPVENRGETPDTEYRRWLAMQSEDYQRKMYATWSPETIAESLDKFQAWQQEVCTLNAAFYGKR